MSNVIDFKTGETIHNQGALNRPVTLETVLANLFEPLDLRDMSSIRLYGFNINAKEICDYVK